MNCLYRRPIYVPWRSGLKVLLLGKGIIAHIAKIIGKGKSQVGKMDAILTDPHQDTSIETCIMINVIVQTLEYAGGVWEGNTKLLKHLDTVQTTTKVKIQSDGQGRGAIQQY